MFSAHKVRQCYAEGARREHFFVNTYNLGCFGIIDAYKLMETFVVMIIAVAIIVRSSLCLLLYHLLFNNYRFLGVVVVGCISFTCFRIVRSMYNWKATKHFRPRNSDIDLLRNAV